MFQLHNTPEEKRIRKGKYQFMLFIGYTSKTARKARDWRNTKIINVILYHPVIIGD